MNADRSLRESLDHEPRPLRFGTSGRRGLVADMTQLEIYIDVRAELEHLLALPPAAGGIGRGDDFYIAHDLRPSSTRFVPEQGGRGEIAQAVEAAVRAAGLRPVNLGAIPTPALAAFALGRRRGSIMVTGSHIPFDRNGWKTNTSRGELRKDDEAPIGRRVEEVRARVHGEPAAASPFGPSGLFRDGHRDLPPAIDAGRAAYVRRYVDFFGSGRLAGLRVLVYQHSAVGRDILVEVLRELGVDAVPAGRSETFIPIDTEAVDEALLATIAGLADREAERGGPFHAAVSTDGDGDRPLFLGFGPGGSPARPRPALRFFGGDLVGMVAAERLGADAAVVPISTNDAIDDGPLAPVLEPKTRIGSPFVIAGMERAAAAGRMRVCGWEANGGFLVGSDIEMDGKVLPALPTRDALLPILAVLDAMEERGVSAEVLFGRLPRRFGRSALLRAVPREVGLAIVGRFPPPVPRATRATFEGARAVLRDAAGRDVAADEAAAGRALGVRADLARFFGGADGFGPIVEIDWTDGVRVRFQGGDVAHVRPSGNADELRIYATAGTPARADEIARRATAEPDGILRRLARTAGG